MTTNTTKNTETAFTSYTTANIRKETATMTKEEIVARINAIEDIARKHHAISAINCTNIERVTIWEDGKIFAYYKSGVVKTYRETLNSADLKLGVKTTPKTVNTFIAKFDGIDELVRHRNHEEMLDRILATPEDPTPTTDTETTTKEGETTMKKDATNTLYLHPTYIDQEHDIAYPLWEMRDLYKTDYLPTAEEDAGGVFSFTDWLDDICFHGEFAKAMTYAEAQDELIRIREFTDTPKATVEALVESIGYERAFDIVATLTALKAWDGRISPINKEWSKANATLTEQEARDAYFYVKDGSLHCCHLDSLASAMRRFVPTDPTSTEEVEVEASAPATETAPEAETPDRFEVALFDRDGDLLGFCPAITRATEASAREALVGLVETAPNAVRGFIFDREKGVRVIGSEFGFCFTREAYEGKTLAEWFETYEDASRIYLHFEYADGSDICFNLEEDFTAMASHIVDIRKESHEMVVRIDLDPSEDPTSIDLGLAPTEEEKAISSEAVIGKTLSEWTDLNMKSGHPTFENVVCHSADGEALLVWDADLYDRAYVSRICEAPHLEDGILHLTLDLVEAETPAPAEEAEEVEPSADSSRPRYILTAFGDGFERAVGSFDDLDEATIEARDRINANPIYHKAEVFDRITKEVVATLTLHLSFEVNGGGGAPCGVDMDDLHDEIAEAITSDDFDDFLDEVEGAVEVCGVSFCPSRVLRELDPVAYSCYFSDWADDQASQAVDTVRARLETYAKDGHYLTDGECVLADMVNIYVRRVVDEPDTSAPKTFSVYLDEDLVATSPSAEDAVTIAEAHVRNDLGVHCVEVRSDANGEVVFEAEASASYVINGDTLNPYDDTYSLHDAIVCTLTDGTHDEEYDEFLDCDGDVEVMGISLLPSEILKKCASGDYRLGRLDWADSIASDIVSNVERYDERDLPPIGDEDTICDDFGFTIYAIRGVGITIGLDLAHFE